MDRTRKRGLVVAVAACLLGIVVCCWLDGRAPEVPAAEATVGGRPPHTVPEPARPHATPPAETPPQREPVSPGVETPPIPRAADADNPEPTKRILQADTMDREALLRAVQEDDRRCRQECLEDLLAVTRARIAAALSGEALLAADVAAREVAEAEFERRSLRNRLLLDLYVWKNAPEFKVGAKGIFLGQWEHLDRGDERIEFVMNCDQFPDYHKALVRSGQAQKQFGQYAAK